MQLGEFTTLSDETQLRRDEPKVYQYYRETLGWDDATIFRNVLFRYSQQDTRFTEHDAHSIMQYQVPKELTIGGFEIGWNTESSALDKTLIAKMYPRTVARPV